MEEISIVKLPEMKVASFHALGAEPEQAASKKLNDWARPRGLLDEPGKHRIFGFNNPCPEPGKAEYGYEFWLEIGEGIDTENLETQVVPSRTYAMMRSEGFENIGPDWHRLMDWVENSSEYEVADGQCLEGSIPGCKYTQDDFRLDIYEPVKIKG